MDVFMHNHLFALIHNCTICTLFTAYFMQSRIAHNLSGLVLPQFYFYNKIVVLLKHIY